MVPADLVPSGLLPASFSLCHHMVEREREREREREMEARTEEQREGGGERERKNGHE